MRTHRMSLMALRNFWQLLLHYDVPFSNLASGLKEIQEASHRADRTFKVMIERWAATRGLPHV